MFARFDENPAMTLRVINETKRYGQMDGRTDGRTDNVKTVYPLQTKFAGGIIPPTNKVCGGYKYTFTLRCSLSIGRSSSVQWGKVGRS